MRVGIRSRRLIAVLTAAGLVSAGCASDPDPSGAGSTAAPAAASSASVQGQSSGVTAPSSTGSVAPAEATSSVAGSPEAPTGEQQTLRVWMQGDTLKDIDIKALNAEFEASHPGVTVDLQEQTWGEYTTKVATGLADTAGTAPDVLELGNTQVAQFAGAGALMELTATDFDNSDAWLGGLEESATYDGKLIAVPYYAGVRVGIYRTDLADKAGVKPPFDSLDDLQAAGVKLLADHGDDGSFSGLYFPSQYWYEGMSFVWDAGGEIATQAADGTWTGALDSAASKAGLQRLKDFVGAVSRGGDGADEADDALVMAQDQAAMFIDASWKPGVVTDKENGNPKLEGKVGIFVVPGSKPGTVLPQFLGGSDIVINGKTPNPDLAKAYTKLLTGKKYQGVLAAKGYIANATTFTPKKGDANAETVVKAASTGRFVPNSKNWTKVEDSRVLQNMFDAVLTGSSSIDDATAEASSRITELLNG